MSNAQDIPVWEKYTLTIEEASKYFRIGENKLRRLAEENKDAGWLIMNGNRIQIDVYKRQTEYRLYPLEIQKNGKKKAHTKHIFVRALNTAILLFLL